jgi:hypothetical protein
VQGPDVLGDLFDRCGLASCKNTRGSSPGRASFILRLPAYGRRLYLGFNRLQLINGFLELLIDRLRIRRLHGGRSLEADLKARGIDPNDVLKSMGIDF